MKQKATGDNSLSKTPLRSTMSSELDHGEQPKRNDRMNAGIEISDGAKEAEDPQCDADAKRSPTFPGDPQCDADAKRSPTFPGATDIASILHSSGPIVKAVVLRHGLLDRKDTELCTSQSVGPDSMDSKSSAQLDEDGKGNHSRPLLNDLVEEIEIDTTPSRNQVVKILGGPFTFLGQWPSEGTVAMVRKSFLADTSEPLHNLSVKTLRKNCELQGIDTSSMIEKSELVTALEDFQSKCLPLNPHRLQPPLHNSAAHGDILIMKVAETKEELDEEDEIEASEVDIMSNDDFFLDYTRDEYLEFASRTDIEAHEPLHHSDDNDEVTEQCDGDSDEAEDSEDDEDFRLEGIDEEEKHGLLNIILGGVIQKFREDSGRGPNTEEVLELRRAVAAELEIPLPCENDDKMLSSVESSVPDGEKRGRGPLSDSRPLKKVKFAGDSTRCEKETSDKDEPSPSSVEIRK